MDSTTETITTYGLRDRATGKFLLLDIVDNHGEDNCGSETVKLTLQRWGEAPRFEVADLMDLVRTFKENPQWYASSRERPQWADFTPDKVVPVVFDTVRTYDAMGGDPISTTTFARAIRFPPRFEGAVGRTRSDISDDILRATFGDAYEAMLETQKDEDWSKAIYPRTVLLDISEGPEIGMLLETPDRNTAQIDAIAKVPENWADHRDYRVDRSNPNLRVALVRTGQVRPYHEPTDFSSFEIEESQPAPAP